MKLSAVVHLPLRMSADHLAFEFELYDGDALVHLGYEAAALEGEGRGTRGEFGGEDVAIVVAIDLHGEGGERHKVDAVAILEGLHVAVSEAYSDHVGHAAFIAGGGAHPESGPRW